MLSQARILGHVAKSASRFAPQSRSMAATSYAVTDYKQPTMDDHPIPSGSWQAAYNAKQSKYNMCLGGAIAFFIGTVIVGIQVGTLNFYTGPELKNKK